MGKIRLLGEVGEVEIKGEGKYEGLKEWNFSLTLMLLPLRASFDTLRGIFPKY